MSATLFREHCRHVCCAFGAGRNSQNGLVSWKCPQAGNVCKAKKHFPIGGKRHHTNRSQNCMANHVIWLLRNRRKLWEGWRWKSDSDGDRGSDSDSEFWELGDLWHLAYFSIFCLMSQNNEETAECGAGSAALHWAGRSWGRPEPEALPAFKCK